MQYKKPKLIGTDENGEYKGIIEQIEASKKYDILDICNRRRNLWVLSLFSGYRQIGRFRVDKPHNFKEGDLIIATKKEGKIIKIVKNPITISNVRELFND